MQEVIKLRGVVCAVDVRLGRVFLPSFRKAFIKPAVEVRNDCLIEGFLSTFYGVIALPDGDADR